METHLYSKRKCLLFSCTICQRTFVCLFYYCLYNSFLFIEHSSMSVNFFSYLKEQDLFSMLKREQSSMYWAIEKSKQTLTNNLWTNSSKYGETPSNPTSYAHLVMRFSLWAQCFSFHVERLEWPTVHVTCLVCCSACQMSVNECCLHNEIHRVFHIPSLHPWSPLFSFLTVCRPLGASFIYTKFTFSYSE